MKSRVRVNPAVNQTELRRSRDPQTVQISRWTYLKPRDFSPRGQKLILNVQKCYTIHILSLLFYISAFNGSDWLANATTLLKRECVPLIGRLVAQSDRIKLYIFIYMI